MPAARSFARSGARTPASSTRSRRSFTSLLPYTRQGESVTSGGLPGSGCSTVPSRSPTQRDTTSSILSPRPDTSTGRTSSRSATVTWPDVWPWMAPTVRL